MKRNWKAALCAAVGFALLIALFGGFSRSRADGGPRVINCNESNRYLEGIDSATVQVNADTMRRVGTKTGRELVGVELTISKTGGRVHLAPTEGLSFLTGVVYGYAGGLDGFSPGAGMTDTLESRLIALDSALDRGVRLSWPVSDGVSKLRLEGVGLMSGDTVRVWAVPAYSPAPVR